MTLGLTNEAKDAMLQATFRGPLLVGLFEGEEEIVDPRYERLPIEFGDPQDDGDIRFIENITEARFPDLGRDHTVDHWGVFDERGMLLALFRLKKPRDLPAEDNAIFRAGRLSIGMP